MALYENMTEFAGLPVEDFREAGDIKDFSKAAPRLRCTYDDELTLRDFLAAMIDQPGVEATPALVLGSWMENGEAVDVTPQSAIEMLVSVKDRLPALKALFVGDIISEENEISWIAQADLSAIWGAFPRLERFGARGGNGLRLGKINHARLQTLIIETGGLPAAVLREALEANAPLRHLELWMGDENYGANTSVEDFRDLMAGSLFPDLQTLGLRNCQYSDALAEALATSPIMDRISVLDLSLGTLSDRGARALLGSGKLSRLQKLDIAHHYVSDDMVRKLKAAVRELNAKDHQKPDQWDGEDHYYVAVGE
jgi:hypothetical protein